MLKTATPVMITKAQRIPPTVPAKMRSLPVLVEATCPSSKDDGLLCSEVGSSRGTVEEEVRSTPDAPIRAHISPMTESEQEEAQGKGAKVRARAVLDGECDEQQRDDPGSDPVEALHRQRDVDVKPME